MEFLLIVFLTLLNGVFAMSELALAASRKVRLGTMADAGDKGAQAALTLLGNPNGSTSNVQEVALGGGLTFAGGVLNTAATGGTVTSISAATG